MPFSLGGPAARALALPARAAFGAAVVGLSAARLSVAAARGGAATGWAITRTGAAATVGAVTSVAAGVLEGVPALVERAPRPPAPAPLGAAAETAKQAVTTTRRTLPGLLVPERRPRRMWAGRGCCHIELRSESVNRDPDFGPELRRQLRALDGVSWTSVNDVLGRVLVGFEDGRLSPGDILDVVVAVERARGHDEHPFDPNRPDHPADAEPVVAAAVQLGVDLLSAAVGISGSFLRLPRAPRSLHALLALTDGQPAVRNRVERRLGPLGTELAFGVARAVLHGATQRPTTMVVDAGQRALRLQELSARRALWLARETELHRLPPQPDDDDWPPPGPRPAPPPDGPIERYANRIALGSLPLGALTLGLTGRPAQAAAVLHAAVPRAARTGREVFATLVGHEASRRGVVALDGSIWRRLDRIDTVVIDSAALGTESGTVLQAVSCSDRWSDARVWATAAALLDPAHAQPGAEVTLVEHPDLPSPTGARVHGLYEGGRQVGYVTIGPKLDPYADAVLDAVRAAGARLLMTEHAAATEVTGRADELLDPEVSLRDAVRRLQEQGRSVLVVSADDGPALAAADAGVGVLRQGSAPAWGADLLCGPGLCNVVHVLETVPVARSVSERCVRYSAAGTTLSWLTTLARPRRRRPLPRLLAPLPAFDPPTAALLSALLVGWLSARSLSRRPDPTPREHILWHALEPQQVQRVIEDRFDDAAGAASADSHTSAGVSVPGSILAPAMGLARTIAAELKDPLTPVLAVGATASAMLGSPTDAALVGSVMAGNALLAAVQRLRAESALGALIADQEAPAHRLSSGHADTVAADDLRVGDIIAVADGDVVPADARLLETHGLEVDESSLTGESLPVAKSVEATPAADLPDRRCMLHQGTTVVAGYGRAVVVAVGADTVAGRTAGAVAGVAPPVGLSARLAELTRTTLPASLIGGAVVSGLGLLRRQPLRPAIAGGVAVAVAAVPEGLPLVATVAQTAVARRLSRRGAVVRSAGVTEALGRVDTVCFDKTGTLTQNRLEFTGAFDAAGNPLPAERIHEVLSVARAATPDGELPHATDRAVATAAEHRNLAPLGERLAELPFTASRGFSLGMVRAAGPAAAVLAVKGAPEIVLARCADLDPGRREAVLDAARRLAGRGLRILAVAERPLDQPEVGDRDADDVARMAQDLRLRGLIGLSDRLRDGAGIAVRQLRAAGVRPVMVTGDHPETAAAIATELGIDTSAVMTGTELARLSEDGRADAAARVSIFARVSPEQKVAVVRALRQSGAVLAMVGDGVNDAAAIRLADVGIGIAAPDSASARSVAHIVLPEANLRAVVAAVGEGRAMWRSVRNAVAVLVGGNAGEIAFSLLGTGIGGASPMNTRQFLLVNLLTDAFPALAVAVTGSRATAPPPEVPADDVLAGHPFEEVLRRGPEAGFSAELRRAVLSRAATTGAGASAAWLVGRFTGTRSRAGTMGLAALVGTQLAQTALVGRRSPLVLLTAVASAAVLVAIVQTPVLCSLFGCVPLDPVAWAVVLAASLAATAVSALAPGLLRAALPAQARVSAVAG